VFGRLQHFIRNIKQQPLWGLTVLGLALVVCVLLALVSAKVWAWYNLDDAEQALEQGDYKLAEKHLQRCLTFWPQNAQAHFWMARAERWLGKFAEADEHLERSQALGWSPSAVDDERILASAQESDFIKWELTLISWAKKDDDRATAAQEVLLQQYAQNSQLKQAMYWGDALLKKHPDHLAVLKTMGFLYDRRANSFNCLACYRRIVELQPDNDEARQTLGEALLKYNDFKEALRHYQILSEHQPESAGILLGLARAQRGVGELAKARRILEELVANDPKNDEALGELGQVAYSQKRLPEAERWLKKALEIYPYHVTNLYTLDLCLKQQGKTRQKEAKKYRARLEKVQADLKRLEFLSGEALSNHPYDPEIPYEIGLICMRNGNTDNGVYWLNQALKLRPGHAGAHRALAKYYEERNNKRLADQHRRLALGAP